MCLGFYMGIIHDFTLAPVHAHMNLLGWVSLFLLGLYYHANAQIVGKAAIIQVSLFISGYITMVSGMAGMFLTGADIFLPISIIGGTLLIISMVFFITIVLKFHPK